MKQHRILLAVAFVFCLSHCSHVQVPITAIPPAPSAATAARGEAIVRNIAVCGQCHAADPKNPDSDLSGGLEFHDWRIGTTRSANLTSDAATGLGNWSEAEIVRAIRNGVAKDGRLLVPVMPYEWFHDMSDDDAYSVARYLKALPPASHSVVQSPNLMFKFGKALFLGPKPASSVNAPPAGATAEYGAYLSQHVGLCAECHTPRTGPKAAPDRSRLFAGMAHPPKSFMANPANITPDRDTGIGKWSEDDFLKTIRTGVDPAGRTMHSFMPWHQLARMSDDDLRAIYRYLRTVPPIDNAVPWTAVP